MKKRDSCDCKKKKYHRKKQLFVSGAVTPVRKKRGKMSLQMSESSDGSFAVPINLVSVVDFKRNIKDCQRFSRRNFSRSLSRLKVSQKG